jgi:N-acetylneuraminate synthase
MKINNRKISENHPPFIVAEMSANHNGNIEDAYKIIDMAIDCGASAIKIQTYRPDTITMDMNTSDFMIDEGLYAGKSLFELYDWAHTPWEWHEDLFKYASKKKITIFSSPFDNTAVDLLEDLNSPAYKIASFEAIDLPLIKYVAQTKKPIIISTGIASFEEIQEAVEVSRENGCNDLAILHCVSSYPAPSADYNLKTILDMREQFNVEVGLSDHTLNNITAISSIAMGASIVEKHVTLNKLGGGPDDSFSLDKQDLTRLCQVLNIAWESIGKVDYTVKKSEIANIKFRRSLYFIEDIRKGEIITSNNVKSIRPGYGLAPKYFENIVGRRVNKDCVRGTPVEMSVFNFDKIN